MYDILKKVITDQDGKELGTIEVEVYLNSAMSVSLSSFIGNFKRTISGEPLGSNIVWCVKNEEWAKLFHQDESMVPWYCPECDKMYSGDKWHSIVEEYDADEFWTSYEYSTGVCPNGHERRLD